MTSVSSFLQLASGAFTRQFWAGSPLFTTLHYNPTEAALTGRTALVTGANSGLGLETAIHLARLDPKLLILAVRTASKGEAARDEIAERSGLDRARIQVWELDMASFARQVKSQERLRDVRAFATRCNTELARLDVACLNAGITGFNWHTTTDGWEETLQVNNLSTGLLGVLLLPVLAKSATLDAGEGSKPFRPHLSVVSSVAHTVFDFVRPASGTLLADLNDESSVNNSRRYQFTKLLCVFIGRRLASLPVAKDVVVNIVNPGLCRTEIFRELPRWVNGLTMATAWSSEDGAKNMAWALLNETPAGAYVDATAVGEPSAFARSDEGLKLEADLWQEMADLWRGVAPESAEILA